MRCVSSISVSNLEAFLNTNCSTNNWSRFPVIIEIRLFFSGKHCMELVDFDRISFAGESQYRGYVITMQPRDCSPKNNLIIGVSPSHNAELNFQSGKE